jgi:hypothetical protein
MLAISPFLVNHFTAEKERISAEILEPESEKPVRRRVLPTRSPVVPQVRDSESSPASPASPTYAAEVSVPEAPVHADVTPDIVTHTDLSQADAPSPVSNASFGKDGTLAGPVVIEGQRGIGVGRPGRGGRGVGGYGNGTGASDVGIETLDTVDAGLGIFDTDVMPGHGLIGQVYVPGIRIKRMPDFGALIPIYTFIAANLDVPVREYTKGFPTPEMQTVVEDFAVRFRGVLAVDTPGRYTFWLLSDDGSKLYIDDTLVIDHDGIHSIRRSKGQKNLSANTKVSWEISGYDFMDMGKRGSMELTAGTHPFEIQYFQGPRNEIALQWFYQPPNSHRQIVPPEVIYRPGKARVPDALKKLQQRLEHIEKVE